MKKKMKATTAHVRSSRFPIEWSDEPDIDPPPGRQAAQALLDELRTSDRVKMQGPLVQDHYYEHSAWFFFFEFDKVSCTVFIEASVVDGSDLWLISVAKNRTMLKALFGKREGRFEIPDECLELLASSVCRAFEVSEVRWLTEDEAGEVFWNEPECSC